MHAALIIILVLVFVQLFCCQQLSVLYCGRLFISQDFFFLPQKVRRSVCGPYKLQLSSIYLYIYIPVHTTAAARNSPFIVYFLIVSNQNII